MFHYFVVHYCFEVLFTPTTTVSTQHLADLAYGFCGWSLPRIYFPERCISPKSSSKAGLAAA